MQLHRSMLIAGGIALVSASATYAMDDAADMSRSSAEGGNTASHDAKSERMEEMHEGMAGDSGMDGTMDGEHGHEVNSDRDASGTTAGGTGSSPASEGQTESAATPTDDSTAAHPSAADDAQRP